MTVVCPLFPINYLLAATKAIGPGDSAGVFLLLTLLLKNYFAVNLAESHTDAFLESEREVERERQANLSRTVFLKHLFHEVRTPLNSLTMGLELLRTRKNDEADQELLTMMTGASTFMANTLNDFLSMQQIEEGKLELIFTPFSINDSISKIVSVIAGGLKEKTLRMEKRVAIDVPNLVLGDVNRVEHVISNLLSNAIKFSPRGGAITVEAKAALVPNSTHSSTSITVSISDQGPGISAENQGQLFDGSFQVRPDQLQQGKGSGLGLALCKKIVTLHGGTIGVESVEGRGSTFHFTIPFGVPTVVVSDDELAATTEVVHGEKEDGLRELLLLPPAAAAASNCAASVLFESAISVQYSTNTSVVNDPTGHSDADFSPRFLVVDGK